MSLFGKKKEEEKKSPACACNSGCPVSKTTEVTSDCCSNAQDGICCVKVLGSGCASCHALYESTKEAVQKMGLAVEVEYVTDLQKVMEYGVMCTGTTYLRNAGKGGTGGGKCGKGPILGGFAAGRPRNRGGMSQLF